MMLRLKQLLDAMPYVFVGMLALVTYLMLIELGPPRGGWPYWDKVQHIAVFAMLTALGLMAHTGASAKLVMGLAVYGALIEWLQSQLTLTRKASIGDWVADLTGILLVLLFLFVYRRWLRQTT